MPDEPVQIQQQLSRLDAIALGVGSMVVQIPAALVVMSLIGAGPAAILSYIIAGIAYLVVALCYADLAGALPLEGGAFAFTRILFGVTTSRVVALAMTLQYALVVVSVSQFSSGMLQGLLTKVGFVLPTWAQASRFQLSGLSISQLQVDVVAATIVLLLTALIATSTRLTFLLIKLLVFIMAFATVAFAAAGLFLIRFTNFVPFNPIGWGTLSLFGGIFERGTQVFGVVAVTLSYCALALVGFDAPTVMAGESIRSERNMPFAVVAGALIGSVLLILPIVIVAGIVPHASLTSDYNLDHLFDVLHIPAIGVIVIVGTICASLNITLTALVVQTRLIYAFAIYEEIRLLKDVDQRRGTPLVATVVCGIILAVSALVVPLDAVYQFVNISVFITFAIVCAAALRLRYHKDKFASTFATPLYPIVPIAGLGFSLYVALVGFLPQTWQGFITLQVVWLVAMTSWKLTMKRAQLERNA